MTTRQESISRALAQASADDQDSLRELAKVLTRCGVTDRPSSHHRKRLDDGRYAWGPPSVVALESPPEFGPAVHVLDPMRRERVELSNGQIMSLMEGRPVPLSHGVTLRLEDAGAASYSVRYGPSDGSWVELGDGPTSGGELLAKWGSLLWDHVT